MSQRHSEYARQPDEAYDTPPPPVRSLAPFLRERGVTHLWDPAADSGRLVTTLREEGFIVTCTTCDFLATTAAPPDVMAIVTNPPYGHGGRRAVVFIEHALELVPIVAMLLRIDFDSGCTRTHLFRDNAAFAQKIILLRRIVWFECEGAPGPSENHCWVIWDKRHRGPATIAYANNNPAVQSAMAMFDALIRGLRDSQSRIPVNE
jgi:hypothetical protein